MEFNTTDPIFKSEVDKCSPENHRRGTITRATMGTPVTSVWCPWTYETVAVVPNFRNWPTCSGCRRPVDIDAIRELEL